MRCTVIIESVLYARAVLSPGVAGINKIDKVQYSWSLEWMGIGESKEDLKCKDILNAEQLC